MLTAVLETNEERLKELFSQKNSDKSTLWHLAIENNVSSTIKFLLQMGKGTDSVNAEHKSVLDLAVAKEDPILLRRLIHDAGFRKANLYYAAKNTEIFNILVQEAKRNMYEINDDGQSLLHAACAYGNFELVTKLLSSGLNVNFEDRFGQTPMHFAVRSRCLDLVMYLHTNRAVLNKPKRYFGIKSHFKSLIIEALKSHDEEILQFLLKNGADTDATDEKGRNSINYACQEGYSSTIIQQLLQNGANPAMFDKQNKCALHYLEKNLSALTLIYSLNPTLFKPVANNPVVSTLTCPICKDEIEECYPNIPCSHQFHHECLFEWQKASLACPLCSALTATICIPKRKTRMTAVLKAINIRPMRF